MSASQSRRRSSFLEHPLCKELNIGSPALCARSRVKKRRSLERRCAMDMITTVQTILSEESDFDTCKITSQTEYAKNDAYNKNGHRPQFRTVYPMHTNRATSCQLASIDRGRPACTPRGFESEGISSCRSSSCSGISHHFTSGNSLLPFEDYSGTGSSLFVPGRRVNNHRDHFNQKGASSSDRHPRTLLPPSLRKLLSSLGNSESLFTKLILGSDEEEVDNNVNADNALLNEMRRMEDINIWNTFREREYE